MKTIWNISLTTTTEARKDFDCIVGFMANDNEKRLEASCGKECIPI